MYSSQSLLPSYLEEQRKLFCLSLPNIFLLILSAFMFIYGYSDEPTNESKFIADAYGDLGNAPQYLRHFGIFAFCICSTTIFSFIVPSMLLHFVFCSLIVALIVIQMHAAVVIYGDVRVSAINMKLKLQSLMGENQTYFSTNHLLVDEIQLASALLILVLPAIFTIKPSFRKKKSR